MHAAAEKGCLFARGENRFGGASGFTCKNLGVDFEGTVMRSIVADISKQNELYDLLFSFRCDLIQGKSWQWARAIDAAICNFQDVLDLFGKNSVSAGLRSGKGGEIIVFPKRMS